MNYPKSYSGAGALKVLTFEFNKAATKPAEIVTFDSNPSLLFFAGVQAVPSIEVRA